MKNHDFIRVYYMATKFRGDYYREKLVCVNCKISIFGVWNAESRNVEDQGYDIDCDVEMIKSVQSL